MLAPEAARERLAGLQVQGWVERRLAALGELPPVPRRIGLSLVGHDEEGRPLSPADASGAPYLAAAPLDALSAEARTSVFEAVFPHLGEPVELAWQLLQRLPYQAGPWRRAFRAPHNPAATLRGRGWWLGRLRAVVEGYEQDVAWFAAWAPYLGYHIYPGYASPDALGTLFAAAIDGGGPEGEAVFDILVASACGEHEVGAMGQHVVQGLLTAARPSGWALVESMLLRAEREEGLRQVILEAADEAHPEAFRSLLRLILAHHLARFSSVVRAADVWFGQLWEASSTAALERALGHVLRFLESAEARAAGLADPDPQMVSFALWATALADAEVAVPPAAALLGEADVARRFAGADVLGQLCLPAAQRALIPALDDEDLRVAARAVQGWQAGPDHSLGETDLFERLERALPRFPAGETRLQPLVWPWLELSASRQALAHLLPACLGSRPPSRLIPHLAEMHPWIRMHLGSLVKGREGEAGARALFLALIADRSATVRERVLESVTTVAIATAEEAAQAEALLARKPGDLRRGVLALLASQADEAALASVRRLLAARNALRRLGGLEMLRRLLEARRCVSACLALARGFKAAGAEEAHLLSLALEGAPRPATLADGLGLYDPAERTQPSPPQARPGLVPVTPAAIACLRSLDALVHSHRASAMTLEFAGGLHELLVGNAGLPMPAPGAPIAEAAEHLPLREVWEDWWANRASDERDDDGLELVRALGALERNDSRWGGGEAPAWERAAGELLYGGFDPWTLRYRSAVRDVLVWLERLQPPAGAIDFLLDVVELSYSLVPQDELAGFGAASWRASYVIQGWRRLAGWQRNYCPELWTDAHQARYWHLLRWLDEPVPGARRYQPGLHELLPAFPAGGATEADLFDLLLNPQSSALWELSGRRLPAPAAGCPGVEDVVERCRRRIVELELARGELATEATPLAWQLRWTGGLETLRQGLAALGRARLVRGWSRDRLDRAAVLSHIIRATMPAGADTPAAFAKAVRAAKVGRRRLIELAVYAPQWASHVEHAVGWHGLAEAVWWIHAHTKGADWTVDREIREAWAAEVATYTPLDAQRLLDGAVDVAWFRRVHDGLGAGRWAEVYRAAVYAASGRGHKRAQLFADALLGRVGEDELMARVTAKRQQDALRALGLVPLAEGEARAAQLLARYQAIQAFLRGTGKFGAQRRASERLAADVAMENLARTAGYPDPQRLQWAMEALAAADLAAGPLTATAGGVTVSLSVDQWGEPELKVEKEGRPLKAIPARVKKAPQVAALVARAREVRQQASRMRRSLEEAMCRGDTFSGAELRQLMAHPVLAPMLEDLVFVGEGVTGYPAEGGQALQSHDGTLQPLAEGQMLRIAHPCDLLATGEWSEWQRECFLAERRQPCKQVYRELYVLTAAERAEGTLSRRYAGQQVDPGRALGLFKARGWVAHPEEGIRRTFHDSGLTAWVSTLGALFTPAEVEGLTIEGVSFAPRGEWRPLPLEQVPPRLFSEVMRDLDLVVSVAHQGGVDPEASASTVEMRAALVRETCALLKLGNVRLQGRHALIEGQLASYSVHLGSAVVHAQPGSALCIVPVHAQHRGRLFLPFADDDPKTAEVLSKVLLLARDGEIKDPTILEQILRRQ